MVSTTFVSLPYIVAPGDGLDAPLGRLGTVHKVPAYVTDGRVAVVEHTLPPRQLGAPLHRHSREDELSFVLSGRLGAKLGDEVIEAGEGSYVLKPRGQWHTFWNAGDTDLRFLELLIPGGFDAYFQWLSTMLAAGDNPGRSAIQTLAAEYGVEIDYDSVPRLCRELGLAFTKHEGF
jgi:quercetin dioxygenase-like cupin family protein